MKHRVVITGMGCISPLGNSVKETWDNLVAGKSGAGTITKFDASAFPTRVAAEVKNFNPEEYVNKKDVKKYDMFCFYALAAAKEAMEQAGLADNNFNH